MLAAAIIDDEVGANEQAIRLDQPTIVTGPPDRQPGLVFANLLQKALLLPYFPGRLLPECRGKTRQQEYGSEYVSRTIIFHMPSRFGAWLRRSDRDTSAAAVM